MGYVLKTTFWLGLVLASMPLDGQPKMSDVLTPAQQAAVCSAASQALASRVGSAYDAWRGLTAMGCATLAAAPASDKPAASMTSSAVVHALTANDRKPRWMGPPMTKPKTG